MQSLKNYYETNARGETTRVKTGAVSTFLILPTPALPSPGDLYLALSLRELPCWWRLLSLPHLHNGFSIQVICLCPVGWFCLFRTSYKWNHMGCPVLSASIMSGVGLLCAAACSQACPFHCCILFPRLCVLHLWSRNMWVVSLPGCHDQSCGEHSQPCFFSWVSVPQSGIAGLADLQLGLLITGGFPEGFP